MSLINCPVCQKEASSNARACPHCGHPFYSDASIKKDLIKPKFSDWVKPHHYLIIAAVIIIILALLFAGK